MMIDKILEAHHHILETDKSGTSLYPWMLKRLEEYYGHHSIINGSHDADQLTLNRYGFRTLLDMPQGIEAFVRAMGEWGQTGKLIHLSSSGSFERRIELALSRTGLDGLVESLTTVELSPRNVECLRSVGEIHEKVYHDETRTIYVGEEDGRCLIDGVWRYTYEPPTTKHTVHASLDRNHLIEIFSASDGLDGFVRYARDVRIRDEILLNSPMKIPRNIIEGSVLDMDGMGTYDTIFFNELIDALGVRVYRFRHGDFEEMRISEGHAIFEPALGTHLELIDNYLHLTEGLTNYDPLSQDYFVVPVDAFLLLAEVDSISRPGGMVMFGDYGNIQRQRFTDSIRFKYNISYVDFWENGSNIHHYDGKNDITYDVAFPVINRVAEMLGWEKRWFGSQKDLHRRFGLDYGLHHKDIRFFTSIYKVP